jgi:hypothetical protein
VRETGSNVNLYQSVDENDYDDADYIRSSDAPSGDAVILAFENPAQAPNEPFRVAYRYKRGGSRVGGTLDIVVTLLEGATQIAQWTHNGVGTSILDGDHEISTGEFNSITDFTNLKVKFDATFTP